MQQIGVDFKKKVISGLSIETEIRGYVDTPFLHHYGISKEICNKMLSGKIDLPMQDADWLRLGRKLGVFKVERKWNTARTDVFNAIEEDILFCKQNAKAMMCVDDCGIGKTHTAKYLSKTLPNCFYVDASQGRTTLLFTQKLATAIGINCMGKHNDIKEDIKCYLSMIENPIVIVDEAGDLSQLTLQEIKEYWNATEGYCAWYLMGADGLKYTMAKGMKNRKPGFKEVFSRFSEKYTTTVPVGKEEKLSFYRKLITDVLKANMADTALLNEIVTKCLITDSSGHISGLRRAESLLILHS